MKEAARQARDGARAELLHHEENLVVSTRETDRLLNEYKYSHFCLSHQSASFVIASLCCSSPTENTTSSSRKLNRIDCFFTNVGNQDLKRTQMAPYSVLEFVGATACGPDSCRPEWQSKGMAFNFFSTAGLARQRRGDRGQRVSSRMNEWSGEWMNERSIWMNERNDDSFTVSPTPPHLHTAIRGRLLWIWRRRANKHTRRHNKKNGINKKKKRDWRCPKGGGGTRRWYDAGKRR